MDALNITSPQIEAQRCLISAWLMRLHHELLTQVRPEWFSGNYSKIVAIMQAIYSDGGYIETLAIMNHDRSLMPDILSCISRYDGGNVGYYVAVIHQEYVRQDMIKTFTDITRKLPDSSDIFEDLKTVTDRMNDWQLTESGKAIELPKLLNERYESLVHRSQSEVKTIGLRSGFAGLDKYIGGLVAGENVVVAGRPGMGKTAFAVSLGIAHAKQGGTVEMYSMEMSKEQLADRVLSMAGQVDNLKVRNADVDEYALKSILSGISDLQIDFTIEDTTTLNIDQIKARIKAKRKKPTLVIIDYMQLVKSAGGKNREQEIAHISRQCKLIAKECHCTVMPLSQLNRQTEEGNSRPKLAHLRESGAIEQDADTVLFPYRPDYYEAMKSGTNPPEIEEAELIIGKCRNGMTGTLPLRFRGKTVEYIF